MSKIPYYWLGLVLFMHHIRINPNQTTMNTSTINRRHFLKGSTALFALCTLGAYAKWFTSTEKTYRVGLIGTGWYGKSDLFRLIQVADIEVIVLSDPHRNLLTEAAELVSQRQKSKKKPLLYNDYREMLAANKLDKIGRASCR